MSIPIELYKSDAISSVDEDALGRKPFIEAVANFIKSQATAVNKEGKKELRNLRDPLTIGIYGKWGYGKTSVVNCVKTEIEKANFFTAYYNPWMYNNEEDLVQHLFETIVSAVNVKEDIENRKELISKLKKYSLGFLKGFKARAKFGIPFTDMGLSVGYDAKPLMEAIEKDIDVESEETIYDVKEEINKVLTSLSNPIVIFIDDIDRLSKTEIYTLFKTVRLIADFKNIIYVLSFDDEMVAKSIKENFAEGKDDDGYNYLEKIIDVSMRLPSLSYKDIFTFLEKKLEKDQFDDSSVPFFQNLLYTTIKEAIRSPRDCNRIINSSLFLKLNLSEIKFVYLFILEALRLNNKPVFSFIKEFYTKTIVFGEISNFQIEDKGQKLAKLLGANYQSNRSNPEIDEWRKFFKELFLVDILYDIKLFEIKDNKVSSKNKFFDGTNDIELGSQGLNSKMLDQYMRFVKNLD